MPNATYQVGHLTEIDPDDPKYPNLSQAEARAVQLSSLRPASGFGIWMSMKDTQLLAIAYAGELFWNDAVSSDCWQKPRSDYCAAGPNIN
ncbi:hypothetical protein [Cupriavidus necator]|uniref:hypothetical protein n=1 Tax=Cupriavidus necator TaxID=106590 RepID=UPI000F50C4BD|nr:hypothetical protein [Cupriavidus necator]